tara:strand:- start:1085 stop:1897 length:813 start_codon:yes stop_codon:yes gene_type:complete
MNNIMNNITGTTTFEYIVESDQINSPCNNWDNLNYNLNNSENILIQEKEMDENITKLTSLKKEVLDILNGQTGLNDSENDHLNYENKEMDDIISKLRTFSEEFKNIQDDLVKADEDLKIEMDKAKQNIKKLDSSVKFFKDISDSENEKVKEIITLVNSLHDEVSNNEELKNAKENYIKQRKKLKKHIYLIKEISNWNKSSATCTICLNGTVDHFINPCGHTFCKTCLIETINRHNIVEITEDNLYNMRRDESNCPLCRENIISVKPLFFS